MNVRLVQLLDDPAGTGKGRKELMIIYSEDLAPTGKALAELATDGKPNASWAPIEQALIERATKAVRVERKSTLVQASAGRRPYAVMIDCRRPGKRWSISAQRE